MSTELKALNGVSTKISQGEFIAIIGHTGSGKTTFIEHLNALSIPQKGTVQIGNRIIQKRFRKIRKINQIRSNVGIVFQFAEYQLFEETILKDIIFGPRNMGIKKEEAILLAKKYIKVVGLDESYLERSPFDLSGGQKRRVALAGILAMEPNVLIFDEPTAGLDPEGSKHMLDIFKELNKAGRTIIIVTHDLDHVLEYSNRTILFKNGKISEDGDTYNILRNVDNLFKNDLEPPRLLQIVEKLEKKGLKIGKVTNLDELAKKLIKIKKGK
jgi:energy-coupling factor transport system ATP-binding protein